MGYKVLYHAFCKDGFGAAWAFHKGMSHLIDQSAVEYIPVSYGQNPPEGLAGHKVIILDFCYSPEILDEIASTAASVLVLDHHISSIQKVRDYIEEPLEDGRCMWLDLGYSQELPIEVWTRYADDPKNTHPGLIQYKSPGLIMFLFSDENTSSGADLAWNFFTRGSRPPVLIQHVQDRDLWKFHMDYTREFCAYLDILDQNFHAWTIANDNYGNSITLGAVLCKKTDMQIAEVTRSPRIVQLKSSETMAWSVPLINCPGSLASEACNKLVEEYGICASYNDTAEGRNFSLRSDKGVDCSKIAAYYGGGGHIGAAGFKVARDHELTKI